MRIELRIEVEAAEREGEMPRPLRIHLRGYGLGSPEAATFRENLKDMGFRFSPQTKSWHRECGKGAIRRLSHAVSDEGFTISPEDYDAALEKLASNGFDGVAELRTQVRESSSSRRTQCASAEELSQVTTYDKATRLRIHKITAGLECVGNAGFLSGWEDLKIFGFKYKGGEEKAWVLQRREGDEERDTTFEEVVKSLRRLSEQRQYLLVGHAAALRWAKALDGTAESDDDDDLPLVVGQVTPAAAEAERFDRAKRRGDYVDLTPTAGGGATDAASPRGRHSATPSTTPGGGDGGGGGGGAATVTGTSGARRRIDMSTERKSRREEVTGVKRERVDDGNSRRSPPVTPDPGGRRRRVDDRGQSEHVTGATQNTQVYAAVGDGGGRGGGGGARVARLQTRCSETPTSTSFPRRCPAHGVPLVTRKAGQNAMPHNRGRKFVCCPIGRLPGCDEVWRWADGTVPFGAESQARFRNHVGQHGLDGYYPDEVCVIT